MSWSSKESCNAARRHQVHQSTALPRSARTVPAQSPQPLGKPRVQRIAKRKNRLIQLKKKPEEHDRITIAMRMLAQKQNRQPTHNPLHVRSPSDSVRKIAEDSLSGHQQLRALGNAHQLHHQQPSARVTPPTRDQNHETKTSSSTVFRLGTDHSNEAIRVEQDLKEPSDRRAARISSPPMSPDETLTDQNPKQT